MMMREWETSLERVGELPIQNILLKLGPKGTALLSSCGKVARNWAEDDIPWSKFMFDELRLDSPLDFFGNPCVTFKAAYKAWREAFRLYPWELVLRVKDFWDRLNGWLYINFSEALVTLRVGASDEDLEEFETTLGVQLPLSMRLLYRFYDGQDVMSGSFPGFSGSPLGLIGGYQYYIMTTNVFLLPLKEIIRETTGNRLAFNLPRNYVIVANSSTSCSKPFFLDCEDGQLYVGTRNFMDYHEMLPCLPRDSITSKDGLLLWLEEHMSRLHNGVIGTRQEGNYRSISLYPLEEPLCSTEITQGIKVCASAVFVPEFTDLRSNTEKYFFTYSVRMSLLPDINGQRLFDSCQLSKRHWIKYANDRVIMDNEGDGVTRKYPILSSAHTDFVYQSWADFPSSPGSMEGSFTFVPGRMTQGSSFEVYVARFPLELPNFIF